MTLAEAIAVIDFECMVFAIMDRDDHELWLPAHVLGKISVIYGQEWNEWEDRLQSGEISPAEYCGGICGFIRSYAKTRFYQRMATTLERLSEKQAEMGVA